MKNAALKWMLVASASVSAAHAGAIAKPEYELLPIGSTRPQGWLLRQLEGDLHTGITGHYDQMHSNVAGNLFAKQERIPGTQVMGSRGIAEKAWWAGEHEGYWMDGLARTAILSGSETDLARVKAWVEGILERFDQTGYIGIYSPEARFPDKGYDGELWTQSRAMQALLAWHEYSGDRRVLDAVAQTVRKTIGHYREKGTYFQRPGIDGGVTHGVGYMDTLEGLWRLTGDDWFAAAAVWLYEDYCGYKGADLAANNLLDAAKPWKDHTPHTAESLHMPGIAAWFSGNADYKRASQSIYPKLARHTNPGGGFVAGKLEAIGEIDGGGDEGNEYCSKTEAIWSLNRLFQYDANLAAGHWIERCALNAAQGARFHPANTGTIYLSRDNRLRADDPSLHGGREIYSAGHRTAACCTLNATRLLPAYIEGMWFRNTRKPGLFANLYGASVLETAVGGVKVKVVQETDYPFSGRVVFRFEVEKPTAFELALRVPPNSGKVSSVPAAVREGDILRLAKTWSNNDSVAIDFGFQVNRRLQHDGRQAVYEWGPLVFALPIAPQIVPWKEIERNGEKTGFYDFLVKPVAPGGWDCIDHPDAAFAKVDLPGDPLNPWAKPVAGLKGTLRNRQGEPVETTLVPLGSTVLRRTTFPLTAGDAAAADRKHTGTSFRDEDDPMRKF